jgi:DNA topoisomerase-1
MKQYKKRSYKTYNKSPPEFEKGESTKLLIVESPSKCDKIEKFLGSQYKCIASKGHLRALDTYKKYNIVFKNIKEKEDHIKIMRTIITQYDKSDIYLASDDDREGEAIAWHICMLFDLPLDTKRIKFNEITKDAIVKSLQEPGIINMSLIQSQQARQVLDVIVGYKISPFLWKYAYNNKENSLSAGRCQTPALKLIYENYLKKKSMKNERNYKVMGWFTSKNIEFQLNKPLISIESFLEKSKKFSYFITSGSHESIKNPPRPLNTSTMLVQASQQYNYSAVEIMSLCQTLYQDGYITYMRTESTKYSEDFLNKGSQYVEKTYGEKYLHEDYSSLKSQNKDPHEAIRVTKIELSKIPENIYKNSKLNTIYHYLWKNTIQSLMAKATYKVYTYSIDAPCDTKYVNNIDIVRFIGWKVVSGSPKSEENDVIFLNTLVDQKVDIKYNKIHAIDNVVCNFSHYNESGLIKKLEDLNIGRPSTYASFIETILTRKYVIKTNIEGEKFLGTDYILTNKIDKVKTEKTVNKEQNKLVITPIGIIVIEFLLQYFEEMFCYDYTKNMEEGLDKITNQECEDWTLICKEAEQKIKTLSKPLKNMVKETYKIDDTHELMWSKNGPVLKQTIISTDDEPTIVLKNVKKDMNIDIDKLKENFYSLEDLLEIESRYIGKYEGEDVYVKNGKYGKYAQIGENRKSLEYVKKPLDAITIDDLKAPDASKNILRIINKDVSIRKSKYGAYVYYKTPIMPKPEFYKLAGFKEGFTYCKEEVLLEWLNKTQNMPYKPKE